MLVQVTCSSEGSSVLVVEESSLLIPLFVNSSTVWHREQLNISMGLAFPVAGAAKYHTMGVETTDIYCPSVLQDRGLRSRCGKGRVGSF
jgi:hypothetical protein